MTTLTTRNANKIFQEWRSRDLDIYLLATIDRSNPKEGWQIQFMPGYEGTHYHNDTLLLYIAPAKARKPKLAKSRYGVFQLANKYKIDSNKILWKEF